MEMSDIMIRAFAHRIGGAGKDVIDLKCWMHYLHTQVDHDDDDDGEVVEPSRFDFTPFALLPFGLRRLSQLSSTNLRSCALSYCRRAGRRRAWRERREACRAQA